MNDILEKLTYLRKQATVERSHYYVGSIIDETIAELTRLYEMERLVKKLVDSPRNKK